MTDNGRFLTSLVDGQTGEVYDVKVAKPRRNKRVYARYAQVNLKAIEFVKSKGLNGSSLNLLLHFIQHMNSENAAIYHPPSLAESLKVSEKTLGRGLDLLTWAGVIDCAVDSQMQLHIRIHPAVAWKAQASLLSDAVRNAPEIADWPESEWGLHLGVKRQTPV